MCGRFALGGLARQQVRNIPVYDIQVDEWIDEERFVPRYNIAPHSHAAVVRRKDNSDPSDPNGLILHTMKWGLVPHWHKHESTHLQTTNARSENLVEGGGMWDSIKGRKRCAVVCQGYFEWQKKGKERFPHFIKFKDGRLMLMAGLFDSVVLEGEFQPLWTFSIVTTSANKEFSWLHDRQPVFLSTRQTLDKWLDTSLQKWTSELTKMVEPYHESVPLLCYQVPKEVGRVGNESPTYIEPIENRKDGIQAMFSKQLNAKSSAPKRERSLSPVEVADKKVKIEGASEGVSTDPSELKTPSPSKKKPVSIGSTKSNMCPQTLPCTELILSQAAKHSPMRSKSSKTTASSPKKIEEYFKKN